jgi:hypothetical protein
MRACVFLIGAWFLTVSACPAADEFKLEEGFVLLFDGKSLAGWKEAANKPTDAKLQALDGQTSAFKGRFKIDAGKLIIDPAIKGDLYIETTREFAKDVHIKFECKPDAKCNNDVFVRGTKFDIALDKKDTQPLKVNEWNTVEIVIAGEKIEHKINGTLVRTAKANAKASTFKLRAEFGGLEIQHLRCKE